MATPIIFPTTSAPGLRPQESGGRLINAFAEKAPVGAPGQLIVRRSPGLERLTTVPTTVHTRGFLDITQGEAFWILDERCFKVAQNFVLTDLGPLAGTDSVTLARNNAVDRNFVAVTNQGCFELHSGSGPTAFADPDLPANPTSVCDFDGYFVWSFGDGKVFTSNLNSTDVDADAFNIEQGLFVRRVVRFAGRLYALGDKWTGVYRDVGTIPFPLAREVTIPRGIVGTHAIAGWETGWTNQLIWAGDDFVVYQLNGYTPTPVSTDDVSRDIQAAVLAGDRDRIEACIYMYEKNAFWTLTCRDRWSWEYNVATGEWNERRSFARANWKGSKSIRIFDKWLIGDQYTGDLYRIGQEFFMEGDDPLVWQVDSGIVTGFPRGMVVPRASFNITAGVGDVPTPEPLVEISWSLDGGYSFGLPILRRLGGIGRTKSHPYVLNSGLSKGQGVRYRLKVSDPVHVGLNGGSLETNLRSFSG